MVGGLGGSVEWVLVWVAVCSGGWFGWQCGVGVGLDGCVEWWSFGWQCGVGGGLDVSVEWVVVWVAVWSVEEIETKSQTERQRDG